MVSSVWGWTAGVAIGCAIEVMMITVLRADKVAQGYSGKLDWLDIVAYLTSEVLIILNYRRVGPLVLRKTGRTERRRR